MADQFQSMPPWLVGEAPSSSSAAAASAGTATGLASTPFDTALSADVPPFDAALFDAELRDAGGLLFDDLDRCPEDTAATHTRLLRDAAALALVGTSGADMFGTASSAASSTRPAPKHSVHMQHYQRAMGGRPRLGSDTDTSAQSVASGGDDALSEVDAGLLGLVSLEDVKPSVPLQLMQRGLGQALGPGSRAVAQDASTSSVTDSVHSADDVFASGHAAGGAGGGAGAARGRSLGLAHDTAAAAAAAAASASASASATAPAAIPAAAPATNSRRRRRVNRFAPDTYAKRAAAQGMPFAQVYHEMSPRVQRGRGVQLLAATMKAYRMTTRAMQQEMQKYDFGGTGQISAADFERALRDAMGVSLRSEDMMQIVECRNGPVAYKAFIKGMHCPLCTTLLAYRSSDLKHVPEETLTAIVTTCKRTSSSTLSPPSPSSAASAAASAATRNAVYRLRTMKVCHNCVMWAKRFDPDARKRGTLSTERRAGCLRQLMRQWSGESSDSGTGATGVAKGRASTKRQTMDAPSSTSARDVGAAMLDQARGSKRRRQLPTVVVTPANRSRSSAIRFLTPEVTLLNSPDLPRLCRASATSKISVILQGERWRQTKTSDGRPIEVVHYVMGPVDDPSHVGVTLRLEHKRQRVHPPPMQPGECMLVEVHPHLNVTAATAMAGSDAQVEAAAFQIVCSNVDASTDEAIGLAIVRRQNELAYQSLLGSMALGAPPANPSSGGARGSGGGSGGGGGSSTGFGTSAWEHALGTSSSASRAAAAAASTDASERHEFCELLLLEMRRQSVVHGGAPWDEWRTSDGYTLLHHAASLGCDEVVFALLGIGADPTLASDDGTAATVASKCGHTALAASLADAAEEASEEAAALLAHTQAQLAIADADDVEDEDMATASPSMASATPEATPPSALLVGAMPALTLPAAAVSADSAGSSSGASDPPSPSSSSPSSASSDAQEAMPRSTSVDEDIEERKDDDGDGIRRSPRSLANRLDSAIRANNAARVLRMLECGVSVNAVLPGEQTPLMVASTCGHVDLMRTLLARGANVHTTGRKGLGPLALAAIKGSSPAVELLLKHGAATEIVDSFGSCTPLGWAAFHGHAEVVRLLAQAGANVDAVSGERRTPLSDAASNRHLATVQALVDAGASVNATDANGRTPLHWAALRSPEAVVRSLAAAGAPCDAVDSKGFTVLALAATTGHRGKVEALVNAGANPGLDGGGGAPADVAAECNHHDIAAFLRQAVTAYTPAAVAAGGAAGGDAGASHSPDAAASTADGAAGGTGGDAAGGSGATAGAVAGGGGGAGGGAGAAAEGGEAEMSGDTAAKAKWLFASDRGSAAAVAALQAQQKGGLKGYKGLASSMASLPNDVVTSVDRAFTAMSARAEAVRGSGAQVVLLVGNTEYRGRQRPCSGNSIVALQRAFHAVGFEMATLGGIAASSRAGHRMRTLVVLRDTSAKDMVTAVAEIAACAPADATVMVYFCGYAAETGAAGLELIGCNGGGELLVKSARVPVVESVVQPLMAGGGGRTLALFVDYVDCAGASEGRRRWATSSAGHRADGDSDGMEDVVVTNLKQLMAPQQHQRHHRQLHHHQQRGSYGLDDAMAALQVGYGTAGVTASASSTSTSSASTSTAAAAAAAAATTGTGTGTGTTTGAAAALLASPMSYNVVLAGCRHAPSTLCTPFTAHVASQVGRLPGAGTGAAEAVDQAVDLTLHSGTSEVLAQPWQATALCV